MSEEYFVGSERYVYYDNGSPHYFYSSRTPSSKKPTASTFIGLIFFFIPFVAIGIYIISLGVSLPHYITGAKDTQIVINDELGLIDNTNELTATLENFAQKTGIVPMIVTISNEEWQSEYSNLKYYTYQKYLHMCDDESHWLIVYSQPQTSDKQLANWYWEGMQGDDTDSVLTKTVLHKFNSTMQKELTISKTSVGSDFKAAFDSISAPIIGLEIDWGQVLCGFIWLALVGLFIFFTFNSLIKNIRCANAQKIPLDATEQTCAYCGKKYIAGTSPTCPHCGATVTDYADKTDSANNRKTVLNGESVNSDNF